MQLPMILKKPQRIKLKKTHKIEIFIRLWGMWNGKEGEWLNKIDCVHIFMRLYFNTEISIGETKVMKSCTVNTLVNTNHCPQNLKKRYRLSLAIVVPQSGSHSHSGDRLFEWPKLSKKRTVNDKWKHLRWNLQYHIYTNLRFAVYPKHVIILLNGSVFFVSYLPFNDYSTISTILKRFFNVKLIKSE